MAGKTRRAALVVSADERKGLCRWQMPRIEDSNLPDLTQTFTGRYMKIVDEGTHLGSKPGGTMPRWQEVQRCYCVRAHSAAYTPCTTPAMRW